MPRLTQHHVVTKLLCERLCERYPDLVKEYFQVFGRRDAAEALFYQAQGISRDQIFGAENCHRADLELELF